MRFEYKILTYETEGFMGNFIAENELEGQFNELGESGWELVSLMQAPKKGGGNTICMMATFRREKKTHFGDMMSTART